LRTLVPFGEEMVGPVHPITPELLIRVGLSTRANSQITPVTVSTIGKSWRRRMVSATR
jgi:hypothetical protein